MAKKRTQPRNGDAYFMDRYRTHSAAVRMGRAQMGEWLADRPQAHSERRKDGKRKAPRDTALALEAGELVNG